MTRVVSTLFVSVLNVCIVHSSSISNRVVVGSEVLRQDSFSILKNETVAVLTNPSGLFPDTLLHIVDYLHFQTDVNISIILAPEHGFRGDHQAESGDIDEYIDKATNLTVHSVYKKNVTQIKKILKSYNVTVLLVDMQDVGTRLYTFIWTMFDVMTAIVGMPDKITVIVPDRPNPVNGITIEGPLLNVTCCASRYGKAPVTHRHGLTIGELARFFDGESFNSTLTKSNALKIIKMQYWERTMMWEDTQLPWVLPSPNLPSAISTLFYLSTVFLEATTVSEGETWCNISNLNFDST